MFLIGATSIHCANDRGNMANSEIIGAGQDTAHRAPKINTITCGDCLEVMQLIPDKSVDMILCDLPYGTTACKWDTIIPFEPLWAQYKRLIKDNGAIVLTASQPFTSALVMSNPGWFKYCWVWNKEVGSNIFNLKRQPFRIHEDICVFGDNENYYPIMVEKAKPQVQGIYKIIDDGSAVTDKEAKQKLAGKIYTHSYPKSILTFSKDKRTLKQLHPTQKPVALFEYLIRTYTNEGDTVLDNCIGSGTTAIACINTGRNYIGIEKEEKYCRIAEERIHALRSPAQDTMEICHTAPNSGRDAIPLDIFEGV